MTNEADTDPLAGPIDDQPDQAGPSTGDSGQDVPKKTDNDDGSEWIPVPEPAEGDGPLP